MDNNQHRIVVGVASREESSAAVRFAIDETRRRHLPVRLVHVLHPALAGPDVDLMSVTRQPFLTQAHQMLENIASEVCDELGDAVPVSTQVLVGRPAGSLVNASRGSALIVLQPARMGQVQHIPTLSVTSAVAARSHLPVIAVPGGWTDSPDGPVTVGVDAERDSGPLLQAAFEEAATREAPLRVVHAWHYGAYDDIVFSEGRAQEHAAELTAKIRDELGPLMKKFSDVTVDLRVQRGRPADTLVAESARSSLLVVARHRSGSHTSHHHLGSIVRAVLHQSPCPVMIVDPDHPAEVTGDVHS